MKNLFVTDLDGTFVKNSVSVAEDDLKSRCNTYDRF